jgi:transcriptional antiterminator RfaH
MSYVISATTVFPDDLFDGCGAQVGGREWWVAYTKVRQEKRLAEDLVLREIPFYLPLVERRHVYRGRRLRSQEPLFGSYVFLFTDARERAQSLATNRIAHTLPVPDGQQLYDDLVQIRRLIEAEVPLTVEARLQPGQRVRVRHGCFAGIEGIVESRCRRTRLTVAITFLQRGISVEIDDVMLDPIS